MLLIENVDVGVVDDCVANRVVEPNDTIDVAVAPCCKFARELHNRTRIAVDKATSCEQFLHDYCWGVDLSVRQTWLAEPLSSRSDGRGIELLISIKSLKECKLTSVKGDDALRE